MSTRPRYHNPGEWAWDGRSETPAVLAALTRLLRVENSTCGCCHRRWHSPPGWRPGPRRFSGPPPGRTFYGTPQPRQWRSHFRGDKRLGDNFQRFPSRPCPWDWKSRALPRRGPPVAAIRVPCWYWLEEGKKRQPRGYEPRGTLRGGPERSAHEPRRKPQGGLCGGPARSAKEP